MFYVAKKDYPVFSAVGKYETLDEAKIAALEWKEVTGDDYGIIKVTQDWTTEDISRG